MFNKKIKKVITIDGMMCSHCQMKVEKSLLELNGVSKVKVNLKDKTATIYSTKSISNDNIKDTISKLDYKIINIGEEEKRKSYLLYYIDNNSNIPTRLQKVTGNFVKCVETLTY